MAAEREKKIVSQGIKPSGAQIEKAFSLSFFAIESKITSHIA